MTAAADQTLALVRQLIACRSVTPADGGCIDLIAGRLSSAGFQCEHIDRGGVRNLWARHGSATPLVCLAGHVDVVPPGPVDGWTSDPFVAVERDGYLYGRGASDMKGPLAALVTAAERFVAAYPDHAGSVALLLTSDEEGAATDGTVAVVETLQHRGETIDACIVGEPTSVKQLGDTVKNGRRGSLGGALTVKGLSCHIAYPERGRNPIHAALPALAELAAITWDQGNEHFQPTSFQFSNVHAGAGTVNVIPGSMEVLFNIRFSPSSTVDALKARVKEVLDRYGVQYDLAWHVSGEPFMTVRGPLLDTLGRAIESVTGVRPALSTGGGTSDGRFIARVAREVVEFGPVAEGMHASNERVRVADLGPLSVIYERTIEELLASR
ncbi:MAG: succinyl-diaminopimelate desuccinylase [Acidobacteria bacterium]|nr:succinyl-diaminopimelate desuccinylase [Acidobacteriota bacterium]